MSGAKRVTVYELGEAVAGRLALAPDRVAALSPRTREMISDAQAFRRAVEAGPADSLEPAERRQHDVVVTAETGRAGVQVRRVETQTTLDRLKHCGAIDEFAWQAGDRLFRDWVASGGQGRAADMSLLRVDGGRGEGLNDAQLQARDRVTKALRAVDEELSPVLVAVVLCGDSTRDWATRMGHHERAGILAMELGLRRLARHYKGLIEPPPDRRRR